MYEGEASMPVVSRIDVRKLAELDKYWGSEGYNIRTMSQLVSWSIDLLAKILENNGKSVGIETVGEAYRWMVNRGLSQPSLQNRGRRKMTAALSFENLRAAGVKPEEYVPSQFNTVNRSNSIQPMPENINTEYVSPNEADYRKAEEMRQKEEAEEKERLIAEAVKNARANNMLAINKIVVPPDKARANMNSWELEQKEREELEKLNGPIDLEFLKKNVVKE